MLVAPSSRRPALRCHTTDTRGWAKVSEEEARETSVRSTHTCRSIAFFTLHNFSESSIECKIGLDAGLVNKCFDHFTVTNWRQALHLHRPVIEYEGRELEGETATVDGEPLRKPRAYVRDPKAKLYIQRRTGRARESIRERERERESRCETTMRCR